MDHPLERLSAYLDGELKPDDKVDVERHLRGCTVCQEALDGYQTVDRHFGDLLEGIRLPAAGTMHVRRTNPPASSPKQRWSQLS